MGEIVGNIGFGNLSARREDERACLQRVRPHGCMPPECLMPGVPFLQLRSGMERKRAWKHRDMDFFAKTDHRCSHQGHQVLAADQAAEAPDVGIKYPKIGRVALTPKQSLGEGRHRFAVATHQLPIAVEKQGRVVNGGHLRAGIHLVASHHDVGSGLARGSTQSLGVFTGGDDGCVPEADAASSPLLKRAVPTFGPIGITREPDFGKHDQVGAALGGFRDQCLGPDQRSLAVHERRRLLYNADAYDFAAAQDRLARFLHHYVCPRYGWMPVWTTMIAAACTCGTPAGTGGPTPCQERACWIRYRPTCWSPRGGLPFGPTSSAEPLRCWNAGRQIGRDFAQHYAAVRSQASPWRE